MPYLARLKQKRFVHQRHQKWSTPSTRVLLTLYYENCGILLSRSFSKNSVKSNFSFNQLWNQWFHEIFFKWEWTHSVEIAEILSHTLLTKISWNHWFYLRVDLTKYFFSEREFLVFPQCADLLKWTIFTLTLF